MPVVVAYLPDRVDVDVVLPHLAEVISRRLGIDTAGVHVMHVRTGPAVTGINRETPWPTAILHGGRRDEALMRATLDDVRQVLSQASGHGLDRVWAQWALADL